MENVKIVIGANFGDEGKGLMTDYFSYEAKKNKKSCIVVCHNGGAQKGHTVVTKDGIRHVFHHFGSGTFNGATTYLSEEYIVNPIIFRKEWLELERKGAKIKCYINKNCRITVPFDMLINQMIEELRGKNKHGSCGLGINETIVRNNNEYLSIYALKEMPIMTQVNTLMNIKEQYLIYRLKQLGVDCVPMKWMEILENSYNIILNFLEDFNFMLSKCEFVDDSILEEYDTVIFEGAQGLMLDQNNLEYMPYLTPSNTGLKNPMKIIGDKKCNIEVCYVTRTYLTRHGAGRFDSECKKEEINSKIIDLTNVPNPYQDSIRYGKMNIEELDKRIQQDLQKYKNRDMKISLAVTHLNEYDMDLKNKALEKYDLYTSNGMTRENILKSF